MDLTTRNNKNNNLEVSEYPLNSESVGTIKEDETFLIFINENVIDEIDSYLASDLLNECGGVLLGNVFKTDTDKLFIVIENLIIAKNTISSVSRLTFTHDTWTNINNELEKYHSDKIIVGWFHSHPGHGVFLSGYDIFIQDNFFNEQYMVAYVYDPVNKDKAFFEWKEGQIIKSNVYNLIKKNFNPQIDLTEPMKNTKHENKSFIKKYLITLSLLIFINFVILAFLIVEHNNMKSQILDLKNENYQLNNQKTSIDKLEFKVNDLILKQLNSEDSVRRSNNLKK